jgi:DnaJ family protein B protein 12
MKLDYYLNPTEIDGWTPSQLSRLDSKAEINYVQELNIQCQSEQNQKQDLVNQAQGWFYQDAEKMHQARTMEMKACRRLDALGIGRGY